MSVWSRCLCVAHGRFEGGGVSGNPEPSVIITRCASCWVSDCWEKRKFRQAWMINLSSACLSEVAWQNVLLSRESIWPVSVQSEPRLYDVETVCLYLGT